MDKVLFLIRGLPGAGKTTLAHIMAEGKYPVIDADEFFVKDGKYIKCDRESKEIHHFEASEWAAKNLSEEMIKGTKRIYVADNVITHREVESYLYLANEYDYKVISIVVENRHGNKSVHDISDGLFKQKLETFQIKL